MKHFVNNRSLFNEYPEGASEIIFGAGCFWGVERDFLGIRWSMGNLCFLFWWTQTKS
jgi:hypothetical protein